MKKQTLTYDIGFEKDGFTSGMGYSTDKDICIRSIPQMLEEPRCPHLRDFEGGTIFVCCLQTGEIVYSQEIPE